MNYKLPTSLRDALKHPEKFKEMLRMLETLQRLRVRSGGREGYIQFSQRDAVIVLGQTTGGGAPPTPADELHPETILWRDRIYAAGGCITDEHIEFADRFIRRLNALSINSKVVYLLPFIGCDLIAARVPLRDQLGVGIATNGNSAFQEADFDYNRGLKGDGSSKYLDILFAPDDLEEQVGAVRRIGYGWWDTKLQDTLTTDDYIMGSFDGTGQTIMRSFANGTVDFQSGNYLGPFVACTANRQKGHYYAQRTGNTSRYGYENGVLYATQTSSESGGISSQHIALFAFRDTPANGGVREFYAGRCACAYVTTGDLTDAEALAMHEFLEEYLIDPLGRMNDDALILDGGDAGDEYTDVLDGGDAGDEFPTIYTGAPEA